MLRETLTHLQLLIPAEAHAPAPQRPERGLADAAVPADVSMRQRVQEALRCLRCHPPVPVPVAGADSPIDQDVTCILQQQSPCHSRINAFHIHGMG